MQAHRCDFFPFCPLGYALLPWMITNSLSFYYRKYIISSFANFEVTPAARYQFTHFTCLTLAWKSDSWYPSNHHCYLCTVNMRGFCYRYLTLEKCSFTSLLSSYQQHRLEQVAWGLFVLRVVIMIFVYLFVFSFFCGGFFTTWKLLRISITGQMRLANSEFSSGGSEATPTFLSLFCLFILLSSSSNMVIFNHLISWHNEQIAMSRKWRPRETKQREGVGERQLCL